MGMVDLRAGKGLTWADRARAPDLFRL